MANLLGQNIGTNYKGILNLNTLNGNLSGTLQAVTDGDGNASPLQLSTTQVGITGPVQTGTGSLYNPFRIGYSNSTISVTNLDLLSVGATANSGSRYSTVLRLGGGSDTAEHFIYGGEGSSTGLIFDRGSTKIAIIGGIFESRGAVNYYRSVNSAVSAFTDLQFDVRNTYYQFNAGTGMGLGITSGVSARLHVRGDGTNPILRLDNSSGTQIASVNNVGDTFNYGTVPNIMYVVNQNGSSSPSGKALAWASNIDVLAGFNFRYLGNVNHSYTSGNGGLLDIGSLGGTFAAAAGSANFRPLNIAYTINNSGAQTGGATGIFLNATETALNGMGHNLMDLQVDNSSKARISNVGTLNLSGNIFANGYVEIGASGAYYYSGRSYITSPSDGTLALFSNSGSTFGRLQFGGTTNAFPAIKRVGTGIELRSADDTLDGEPTFTTFNLQVRNLMFGAGALIFGYAGGTTGFRISNVGAASFGVGVTDAVASAQLEIVSTTKGFLPPRGTNTEMLAISSPATGLVFYDTTNNKLNCYDGTTWQPCW